MGRRADQVPENYTLENFRAWTDRSRVNLGVDTLDLVQLHCPPSPVYSSDAVFDALDTLVGEERIAAYGVSVETCAEALTAIARPGTATVQIILNAFRRKPLDEVLPAAAAAGVGIIARVPLASGLLSGRYTRDTTFAADDHRSYNRHGEAFDVGETFSGVDYEAGVDAAHEFAALALPGATPAQTALRWVIQQPGVTTVIPGARNAGQARQNSAAADLPPLSQRGARTRSRTCTTSISAPRYTPLVTAADWATVASLATALGTLVLAVATFSAVRSGNRTARAAELSLLTTLRPLLTPSRRSDAVLKVNFGDDKWLRVPGSSGVAEMGGGDGTMGRRRRPGLAGRATGATPPGSLGQAGDETDRPAWMATVAPHWSIDRPDPRRADPPSG